eukprot:scaffold83811_cov15-Tisochrysis_lutea.AAC.1
MQRCLGCAIATGRWKVGSESCVEWGLARLLSSSQVPGEPCSGYSVLLDFLDLGKKKKGHIAVPACKVGFAEETRGAGNQPDILAEGATCWGSLAPQLGGIQCGPQSDQRELRAALGGCFKTDCAGDAVSRNMV